MLSPNIHPRSNSVPIDILSEDETPDLGFMIPDSAVTHVQKNVSSELDTNQREDIRDQLKFSAKQLDDRIYFHTNRLYNEYDDLSLSPDSNSTLHYGDSNLTPPLPEFKRTFTT